MTIEGKDHPIIFSAPMVRALLDGRKTMTRRHARYGSPWMRVLSGHRLWVRECVAYINNEEFGGESYWQYRADTDGECFAGEWPDHERDNPERPRWRSSIHCPRKASRLTLIVTATKIERLQDIGEGDAKAEGIQRLDAKTWGIPGEGQPQSFNGGPVAAFSALWMSVHGSLESWNGNPEVVALTFKCVKANIDTPQAKVA